MPENKTRTTMSVPEMAKLLGLKKTDSYWLVHKKCFETILVNGKMRIVLASFEEWYARQVKYRKITGEEPGQILAQHSFSISEVSEMLQICESCVYDLLKREHIKTITVDYWTRVSKENFYEWIAHQTRYRLPERRARDQEAEEASYTLPEMGRILGLNRSDAYEIARQNQAQLDFIVIAEKKRVTKKSFERWYASQNTYIKLSERKEAKSSSEPAKPRIPLEEKSAYTVQDVADLLLLDDRDIYRMIDQQELHARQIGKQYRIMREDYLEWLNKNCSQATTTNEER